MVVFLNSLVVRCPGRVTAWRPVAGRGCPTRVRRNQGGRRLTGCGGEGARGRPREVVAKDRVYPYPPVRVASGLLRRPGRPRSEAPGPPEGTPAGYAASRVPPRGRRSRRVR